MHWGWYVAGVWALFMIVLLAAVHGATKGRNGKR